jgi:hypothetical protein
LTRLGFGWINVGSFDELRWRDARLDEEIRRNCRTCVSSLIVAENNFEFNEMANVTYCDALSGRATHHHIASLRRDRSFRRVSQFPCGGDRKPAKGRLPKALAKPDRLTA